MLEYYCNSKDIKINYVCRVINKIKKIKIIKRNKKNEKRFNGVEKFVENNFEYVGEFGRKVRKFIMMKIRRKIFMV